MAIAAVLVIGAVAAFVAMSGGKKKDNEPGPGLNVPTTQPGPIKPKGPEGPTRMVRPRVDNELYQQGKALIDQMKPMYEKASGLYDDAQQVKDDDPDMWQTLLRQANDEMRGINDLFNELIGMMPSNEDWDEEQVANEYFGKLYSKLGKVDELKMAIRKNIRSK